MWAWYIAAMMAGAIVTNIILKPLSTHKKEWWEDFPQSTNVEDRRNEHQ